MPYIPIYNRAPNKLVHLRYDPFDDLHGHTGVTTTAVYKDKNKRLKELVIVIDWD